MIKFKNCIRPIESVAIVYQENPSSYELINIDKEYQCSEQKIINATRCFQNSSTCQCQFVYVGKNDREPEIPHKYQLNITAIAIGISIPILLLIIVTILAIIYSQQSQRGKYNAKKYELDGAMEAFRYLKPPKQEYYV